MIMLRKMRWRMIMLIMMVSKGRKIMMLRIIMWRRRKEMPQIRFTLCASPRSRNAHGQNTRVSFLRKFAGKTPRPRVSTLIKNRP